MTGPSRPTTTPRPHTSARTPLVRTQDMHGNDADFQRDPLVRELALAVALKFVLLGVLWFAFFHAKDAPPGREAVVERIYGPVQSPVSAPEAKSDRGV